MLHFVGKVILANEDLDSYTKVLPSSMARDAREVEGKAAGGEVPFGCGRQRARRAILIMAISRRYRVS